MRILRSFALSVAAVAGLAAPAVIAAAPASAASTVTTSIQICTTTNNLSDAVAYDYVNGKAVALGGVATQGRGNCASASFTTSTTETVVVTGVVDQNGGHVFGAACFARLGGTVQVTESSSSGHASESFSGDTTSCESEAAAGITSPLLPETASEPTSPSTSTPQQPSTPAQP